MYALVIPIILFKQALSLKTCLRWLYNSLSGLSVDELLHLVSIFKNSSSEKGSQKEDDIKAILSRMSSSILWCRAVLKEL